MYPHSQAQRSYAVGSKVRELALGKMSVVSNPAEVAQVELGAAGFNLIRRSYLYRRK